MCGYNVYILSVFLFFIAFTVIGSPTLSPTYVDKLSNAIYVIEGGKNAKHPFGVMTETDYNKCKAICRNTINNNYRRWLSSKGNKDFITYLGYKYCPGQDGQHWIRLVKSKL